MREPRDETDSVSIAGRISSEVSSWPGVTAESHRGGMIFFHVGRREIGHLHGERLADLPFPEFVDYCREAGAEVVELSGWPQSYAGTLVLDDAGIEVVAVGCPSDLVQPTAEGMAAQVALIARHVEIAVERHA